MNKVTNTLKMMGVPAMKALFFADNLKCFHLTIGQDLKEKMRNEMLDTVVMDKTFREWFEYFAKDAIKKRATFLDINGMKIPYELKDIKPNNLDASNIHALLELVLQEFYKKEY